MELGAVFKINNLVRRTLQAKEALERIKKEGLSLAPSQQPT